MANTLITAVGKTLFADRVRGTAGTYTNPPKYVCQGAYTTGTKTGLVTDSALLFERETRVAGTESTVTTTYTGDTYQVTGTITATGTYSVNEFALNDTSGSAAFHTTANGATGTGTSITVNNAGPSSAFVVQCEDEVWNVTAGGTTTTWTVARGYGAYGTVGGLVGGTTTAVSHANSADIGRSVGSYFLSATIVSIGLNSGDSISWTAKTQLS